MRSKKHMQECQNPSGNIINRKLSIFYIEAVPQLFFQLQKKYFFRDQDFWFFRFSGKDLGISYTTEHYGKPWYCGEMDL